MVPQSTEMLALTTNSSPIFYEPRNKSNKATDRRQNQVSLYDVFKTHRMFLFDEELMRAGNKGNQGASADLEQAIIANRKQWQPDHTKPLCRQI